MCFGVVVGSSALVWAKSWSCTLRPRVLYRGPESPNVKTGFVMPLSMVNLVGRQSGVARFGPMMDVNEFGLFSRKPRTVIQTVPACWQQRCCGCHSIYKHQLKAT